MMICQKSMYTNPPNDTDKIVAVYIWNKVGSCKPATHLVARRNVTGYILLGSDKAGMIRIRQWRHVG